MCYYKDLLLNRIRLMNIVNISISIVSLIFIFIITIPYNSEYLPTSYNQLFFTNLIVISINFLQFTTNLLYKNINKLILFFSLIVKIIIGGVILTVLIENFSIYHNGELIKDFSCAQVQFKNSTINGLDAFLIQLDQNLCSEDCVCKIKSMRDYDIKVDQVTLNQWIFDSNHGVINSQSCELKDKNIFLSKGNISEKDVFFYSENRGNESLNIEKFSSFWGYVEENFQCNGFCVNSYLNKLGIRNSFSKYLFTDVNLGVPKFLGCYDSIKNWVIKYYFYSTITFLIIFLPYLISFFLYVFLIFLSKNRPYQKASQINYSDSFESSIQMNDLYSP